MDEININEYAVERFAAGAGVQTSPVDSSSVQTLQNTKHIIFSLGPKKSSGADQLDPHLLLLAAPDITRALMHIFNFTLITGIIQTVWKLLLFLHCTNVVLWVTSVIIIKLPCLLEQLVNSQLNKFLSTFNILNLHQSGYRSAHSNT